MPKKAPTIKDVAARAGVSLMAVSRVCNPGVNGQVSTEMREKVLAAIQELGYHPDTLARSLRRRKSDTVGFYNGYRGIFTIGDDFPRAIFTGLQDASTELGQDLLIFHVPETPVSPADTARELSTSKADGVIFLPEQGDDELARLLADSHQNVVAIVEPLPGLPAITAQDAAGSRQIAEHLFARGHRHVMYRQSRLALTSAARRYEGFREAAETLGMTVTATKTTLPHDALDGGERDLLRQAAQEGITAIAAWHDYSAIQALLHCREIGLRIPEDMAIAGFDNLPPRICPPEVALTTINVNWSEIARRGVTYIVNGRESAARPDLGDEIVDDGGRYEIAIACRLSVGNTT